MGGFKATNISLESDSNARKDLIDMGIKIGMASFKAGEAEFSNFHYDYSLKTFMLKRWVNCPRVLCSIQVRGGFS